jgi:hypothetical protein
MGSHTPKIVFVGDTSLRTPHFGCQLVGQTFREQFTRVGVDLIASLPTKIEMISDYRRYLEQADLVVINGEGSIHHGRFQNLVDLAGDYPCALVNCVYQENPENPNLKKFKWISARESMSAAAISEQGVNVEVVPDVLFASSFLRSYVPVTQVVKDFGFTDCAEKVVRRLGPMRFRYRPGFSPKTKVVGDYLNFLASHKRMAIGRFHAAICCSVMGIPFSTWDSNTWKTEGLMYDMGVPQLHFGSRDEALKNAPEVFPDEIVHFRSDARRRIELMFDQLAEIA